MILSKYQFKTIDSGLTRKTDSISSVNLLILGLIIRSAGRPWRFEFFSAVNHAIITAQ